MTKRPDRFFIGCSGEGHSVGTGSDGRIEPMTIARARRARKRLADTLVLEEVVIYELVQVNDGKTT